MTRRLPLVLTLAAACGAPPVKTSPKPTHPPVVIAIVVDQLAAWMIDERMPFLPPGGGFNRLRREGTWHKKMRYAHAATDTGPGHAALYTGEPPRDSGVWGNERVEDDGVKRSIFRDPRTKVVAPSPDAGDVSYSWLPVKKPLITDRLRAAFPDAVIISLSMKDRSAILGAGRRPTIALWFDRDLDTFATSSIYTSEFPPWAIPIAGHEAIVARRQKPWTPLDPVWLERHAGVPDDGPEEGDLDGFGTKFPHDFAASKQAARAMRSTPIADEIVLDLAVAALERLARADAPLFLALSLSGNDYVGHLFGPISRESWDHTLRLDAALGRFFGVLDSRYGPDGWSALLTADHGAEHPFKHRLIHKDIAARLEELAVKELGPGPWVAGVADPYVLLSAAARALPPEKLDALMALLLADLKTMPGVADALDARKTAPSCPPEEDESIPALVCRSLPPTDDPRIFVLLAGDGGWDPDIVIGKGGNHGSPRDEDRTVPLFVRAPGRVAAGRVNDAPVSYRLFGRSLSSLLGLP